MNINTANSEELQQVPGIGPATAQKILQMRKSYGAFKSVDDLLAIRGLGQKRLDKMRKYLTVGKAVAPKTVQPAANPASSPQKPPGKPQERFLTFAGRPSRSDRDGKKKSARFVRNDGRGAGDEAEASLRCV